MLLVRSRLPYATLPCPVGDRVTRIVSALGRLSATVVPAILLWREDQQEALEAADLCL